ncbi:MAG: flagellar biosynthetic protein FliR [Actinomycetota bacterium]
MTFALDPALIVAFGLAMTRLVAAFTIAPPFGGLMLPVRVRVALAVAIAIAATPSAVTTEVPLDPVPLAIAVAYQVVVGLIFGYLLQLVLSAPTLAGGLVDSVAGLSAGALFDPSLNTSSSAGGRLHQMTALIVLVITDGHLLMIRGVIRTYEAAPLSGLRIAPLPDVLRDGVAAMLLAAIEIALPLLVALLLTEVMLGLASRAAPRLNVMILGFAVKSLVFLLGFALTIPLLINAVAALLDQALRWGVGVGGG